MADTKKPGRARNGAAKELAKQREGIARDAKCFGMWLDGSTLQAIATTHGWTSPSTAHDAIKRHIGRTPDTEVDAARLSSLTRLRTVAASIMARMEAGPADTALCRLAGTLVQVEARLAAIVGIDAPKRTDPFIQDHGPIEIHSREDQLVWMKAVRKDLDRRIPLLEEALLDGG